MPEIGMTFPADWHRVKEQLESLDSEFMRYDDFRQLCAEEGITDECDLDTLSWLLHRLGIALNYRKDSRLRETSVLRPEWVTEGIYKIINATTLAKRHGELLLEDLSEILPADRYPPDKHAFLIELMRKFSLCFAFPDADERYLVPDLLQKEEPEELKHFVPSDCLNFEYHYDVLPEFLVPRFIVRSHSMSHERPRWRSGVVLARENCVALVTSQQADRRVIVRVRGGNASLRRELLAVIRYDLERINAEFKDALGAVAKVPLSNHPFYAVDYEKLRAFEREGIAEFPEYVGNAVVKVDVKAHLDGVDVKVAERKEAPAFARIPSVFFSYAHEDESLRDELETHLKLLQRQRVIGTWHDRKILPGGDWDHEIARELEEASIILLLVSAHFLASDYCWERELARALERAERREATVIPILLRSCDWDGAPFCKLQGLPRDMRPINEWPNRDAAWTDVAKKIRALATLA
jgi:internalin A